MRWITFIVIPFIFILIISWKLIIPLLILIPALWLSFSFINNDNKIIELNNDYKIVQVISSGYVINDKNNKILLKTKNSFNIDDLINVKSTDIQSLKNKKEQYDYYLKSLGIKYIANNLEIKKLNNKTSIRSKILNYLLDGPTYYVKYISLILIGKKNDANKDLYEKVKYISILHLFVISGFHINLLMGILLWIGKKLKRKVIYVNFIGFIIVFLYLYILGFPLSSVRAYMFLFFCFINKNFLNVRFSKINILTLIMFVMFLFNPFVVFSLSFIFTFIITFAILFIIDSKNKKTKLFRIVLFSYLASLFISINVNEWVNVFGIINSIIFTPIILFNYIVSFFLFPFKVLLNNYFIFLDGIINLFHNNSLIINVKLTKEIIDLYYLSFSLVLICVKHYDIIRNKSIYNHRRLIKI